MRSPARVVFAACGIACLSASLLVAQGPAADLRVGATYAEFCASCHGVDLKGGRGPSLLDPRLAQQTEQIVNAILGGHLGLAAPREQSRIPEATARALASYIRERSGLAAAAGQKWTLNEVDAGKIVRTQHYVIQIQTVVQGLQSPWAMAFLPDGRILVTEKSGRLRIVHDYKLTPNPVNGTPKVVPKGQGGLLDVAIDPDYSTNGWVYLTYTEPGDGDYSMTAVTRGKVVDGLWLQNHTVFRAPRETHRHSILHYGSAMSFDAAGYLYFSIGDRGFGADAQDIGRPNGKLHRSHRDGRIPSDNPHPFARFPSVWSTGHRNPQGLAVHPSTGDLWEVEHGPRGGDELNVITGGGNYGWPSTTSGLTYTGSPISSDVDMARFVKPVYEWTPSITPSSMMFYAGARFEHWKGNLFIGSLTFQDLRRLEIDGQRVVHEEVLFNGLGRVRDVATGPDGSVYVLLNQPDRIARVSLLEDR